MIHVRQLTPEDSATLKELKEAVQEAVKASQIPFTTFNNFADHLIRTYFEVPEGVMINVQDYELSGDNSFIVKYDQAARVL
jgi:hypothetical protein